MDEETERSEIPWEGDEELGPERSVPTARLAPVPAPVIAPAMAPVMPPSDEEDKQTAQSLHAGYDEQDFDDRDDEPFDRPDAHKLGIIGGKGVGKTYLFQAMFYRCFSGKQSGALTKYLQPEGAHLFIARGETGGDGRQITKTGKARTLNRVGFIHEYENWQRLSTTKKEVQQWYRLRLLYRTGVWGRDRSALDVEFFDASGEGLLGLETLSPQDREVWDKAYLDARVMVFCLPLWAAFPNGNLTDDEWMIREGLIGGLEQVVNHYKDMRRRHNRTTAVSSILALTMADDRRSALRALHDAWIKPYLDSPHTILRRLRKETGIARYIANARKISEAVLEEFASSRAPQVASIPGSLDFGRGEPWIVPLSAIDGDRLQDLEDRYRNRPDDSARLMEARNAAPTPVHVELPLLLALCERENALM
jgi:hypothetical protein